MFGRRQTAIWKLQRPIVGGNYDSNTILEVMAYPEDRSRLALIPLPVEQVDKLFGDELKIYVRGRVKRGNLVVDEIVEGQPW